LFWIEEIGCDLSAGVAHNTTLHNDFFSKPSFLFLFNLLANPANFVPFLLSLKAIVKNKKKPHARHLTP